jgi:hypothetical protein
MKIVFDPEFSSLEEISVTYRGKAIVLKRGVAKDLPEELSTMLLQEPNKFKAEQASA